MISNKNNFKENQTFEDSGFSIDDEIDGSSSCETNANLQESMNSLIESIGLIADSIGNSDDCFSNGTCDQNSIFGKLNDILINHLGDNADQNPGSNTLFQIANSIKDSVSSEFDQFNDPTLFGNVSEMKDFVQKAIGDCADNTICNSLQGISQEISKIETLISENNPSSNLNQISETLGNCGTGTVCQSLSSILANTINLPNSMNESFLGLQTNIETKIETLSEKILGISSEIGDCGSGTICSDISRIANKTDLIGNAYDSFSTGSLFGRLANVFLKTNLIGNTNDPAGTNSLFGAIAGLSNLISENCPTKTQNCLALNTSSAFVREWFGDTCTIMLDIPCNLIPNIETYFTMNYYIS